MNKIEYINENGGKIRKCTTTNKTSVFDFLDNVYSINMLRQTDIIEKFFDDSDYKEYLVQDKYNRLFLYGYREEMNYNGGGDRVDEMWSLVKDSEDSKKVNAIWGRTPCIYTCESGHTYIQEYEY